MAAAHLILEKEPIQELMASCMTSIADYYYQQVHKELLSKLANSGKCFNCGCINPGLKKEGNHICFSVVIFFSDDI